MDNTIVFNNNLRSSRININNYENNNNITVRPSFKTIPNINTNHYNTDHYDSKIIPTSPTYINTNN